MTHVSKGLWQAYLANSLGAAERTACEAHMAQCDPCLEQYMACLEASEQDMPAPTDEPAFAEAVMARWDDQAASTAARREAEESPSRRKRGWLQQPLFHYAVAAAVTMLLMGTGAFQALTQHVNASEHERADVPPASRVSVTSALMEKTIGMLESIQPKSERGELHE